MTSDGLAAPGRETPSAHEPLLAGQSVIVGSATGRVARIDLESGKASCNVAPDGARSSMPRIPAPAADAKRVYFASNDPRLFALDLATGAVRLAAIACAASA